MKINEIEAKTGMDRANIRFYEREGLIAPKRLENGYRDYSEEDLRILQSIKLLRGLHISLDEIKALQTHDKELSDILSQQVRRLEQEKEDASYAQEVCLAMQEDRVSFDTLDAEKYLAGVSRGAEPSGFGEALIKEDVLPQPFYPWRRYLARMLDLALYSVIWEAILVFVFRVNVVTRGNATRIFDSYVGVVLMLVVEPLLLHYWGTTVGKGVFGLRIEDREGKYLSYGEALSRTWGVFGTGMGYNLPIYSLYCLWRSYKRCSKNEMQPWDVEITYTIAEPAWQRNVAYVLSAVVLFVLTLGIVVAKLPPPNRGDLTVADFVENYNYYAKFYDIEQGNYYLNTQGQWAEREFTGTVYVSLGGEERPEFQFTLEGDKLTGVSFVVESQGTYDWPSSYSNTMILTSLAFAGAKEDVGMYSKVPNRIMEQIGSHQFADFSFSEAGILFSCEVDYSGYFDAQNGFLFPEEDTADAYFRLAFALVGVGCT